MYLRSFIALILVFVMVLPGCEAPPDLTQFETRKNDPANENAHKSWTVMMYGCLDIEEGLERALLRELQDMVQIGNANGNIHLVSQVDLRGFGKNGANTTKRYYMNPKSLIVKGDYSNVNTGDPRIFEDFLRWGLDYKADNYALIILGHGTGWISLSGENSVTDDVLEFAHWYKSLSSARNLDSNVAALKRNMTISVPQRELAQASVSALSLNLDDISVAAAQTNKRSFGYDHSDDDCITLNEAEAVFQRVLNGRRLAVCAFRSCLMNGVEVLHSFAPFVDYLVVSETTQYGLPGHPLLSLLGVRGGFDTHFLKEIQKNGRMNPETMAKNMTISLNNTNKKILDISPSLSFQISCYDLQKIRALNRSIRHLATRISTTSVDRNSLSQAIFEARDQATAFGGIFEGLYQTKPTDYEFIDFPEFLFNLERVIGDLKFMAGPAGQQELDQMINDARTIRQTLEQATIISFDNLTNPGKLTQTDKASTHIYFPSKTPVFSLMWTRAIRKHYTRLSFTQSSGFADIIDFVHNK